MTIAITLKDNDGVVVASDSATTMSFGNEGNVYNHADKLFNLHKGAPIAAVGFGLGNIGPASLATLMKDLRVRFSGLEARDAHRPEDVLDRRCCEGGRRTSSSMNTTSRSTSRCPGLAKERTGPTSG